MERLGIIGYTPLAGTSETDASEDTLYGRYVTVGDNIVVPKLTVYVDAGSGSGGQEVRGGIWDGDGAVVASTETVMIADGSPAQWLDLPFTDAVALIPGDYAEGAHFGAVDDSAAVLRNGTTDGWTDSAAFADGLPALTESAAAEPAMFMTAIPQGQPLSIDVDIEDLQLARMGFYTAQEALGYGQEAIPGTRRNAVAGWHGRKLDPEMQGASVAIVQKGGALEDLLGARIRVGTSRASVNAYVHNALDLGTGEDLSLSRRLYSALGSLAATELRVVVDVLGS